MNEVPHPDHSTRAQPESIAGKDDWRGAGGGDHDQPFSGFRAYQFSTAQLARLLRLRGEVLETRLSGGGRWSDDLAAFRS